MTTTHLKVSAWRSSALALCLDVTLGSWFLGCASTAIHSGKSVSPPVSNSRRQRAATGIFHRVKAGETLWKISRAYRVSIEDIVLANELSAADSISVGQQLFIPGASTVLESSHSSKVIQAATTGPSSKGSKGITPPEASKTQGSTFSERSKAAHGNWQTKADDEDRVSGFSDTGQSAKNRYGKDSEPFLPLDETSSKQYAPPPATPNKPLNWPVRGVLYAKFGKRGQSVHDGIDIAAPEATPIRTAAAGIVLFSAHQPGYGNTVIVEHSEGLLTIYAHNRENLVKEGDKVRLGQVIARMGTGTATSGPYLHFEVRVGGEPKDPLKFLPPPK